MYGKGGIGKSTMSSNLTAALSDKGYKVLQIGCDPKHDSTRLLLNGEIKSTILDYLRDTPMDKRSLGDVVSEGYKGCLCAEAGGPEPGVGCAGRGIISSFELLDDLGLEDIERDVTLYDVLGDVVCGGFAVPLRNEYAELIYIVSSGEFMSIYAANNILKGICNYDRNRVGGIIFNSRGDPEEELRIRKFSDAVKIPIVASFERSELFMTAEENGKTVVEMYPESELTRKFRKLAEDVMSLRKYPSQFLDERELEMCILGRSVKKNTKRAENISGKVTEYRKKYVSRNVLNDEPYGGCAFSGADSTCSSTEGLATILHAPRSCVQFAFQCVSNTYGRYKRYHIPIDRFREPCVGCTDMDESDMIFGGTEKLAKDIEYVIAKGEKDIAVVTSCPSGIIGDDVKGVVKNMESKHPGVRIALVEVDGNLKGDFVQGVIDAGIVLCERFAEDCEKTDTVNLVGTKALALNNLNSVSVIEGMLKKLGIKVNCLFPACSSVDAISRISSARLNIKMNPDIFAEQLCGYLGERFGIDTCPIPIRPGISGSLAWLEYVARYFGKEDMLPQLREELEKEFDELSSRFVKVLKGKRYCMLSVTKDIDWILEAAEKAGMIRERAVIVERSDYSNDMSLVNQYSDIQIVNKLDAAAEMEILYKINPDVVISTLPIAEELPNMPIPIVHIPGPFTGIDYLRRLAAIIVSQGQEGWRKDVV